MTQGYPRARMPSRIVLFGATGYTGRLVAERLAASGAAPVLAGRSEADLRALGERLGAAWRVADASREDSVRALLEPGDVLVTTVGPFARWGEPAVRAALSARATYLDSTGEPAFIRRVFEDFGAEAARAGAALLPAMGYDYVPGALAGALALERAAAGGERAAVRVDIGYFALGMRGTSAGTRASAIGVALDRAHAFRGGRLRRVRTADRRRAFTVAGRRREAISIGGAEHYGLPAVFPGLREVNVHLGWFGSLAPALQVASVAGAVAGRLPGARAALHAAAPRIAALGRAPAGATPGGGSYVVAEAYDAAGGRLAEVHVAGADPYAFTGGILAWAARRAAAAGVARAGALGPVEAFGLRELEAGCAEAGLAVVVP